MFIIFLIQYLFFNMFVLIYRFYSLHLYENLSPKLNFFVSTQIQWHIQDSRILAGDRYLFIYLLYFLGWEYTSLILTRAHSCPFIYWFIAFKCRSLDLENLVVGVASVLHTKTVTALVRPRTAARALQNNGWNQLFHWDYSRVLASASGFDRA